MRAAVLYEANTPLVVEAVQTRKPEDREVLVTTKFAGLCHSDLHFMEGLFPHPMPVVLGHEAAGVVEAVGPNVTYVKPGDHVISCPAVFCGACEMCLSGRPSICLNATIRLPPGVARRLEWDKTDLLHSFFNLSSFADQMLVHENALTKIRNDMPFDRAALIGCSVVTGFGAVVNAAKVRPGETVAIIGCGGVGMAAINGANIAGAARIIAVDTNPTKLQLATKLGATDLVNPDDGDPVERVKEMTDGGVHHAIECVGHKTTAEQAFQMTGRGGIATIVGMVQYGQKLEIHGFDLLRGRRLQGCAMGDGSFRIDMPRLVDMYIQGRLHLDTFITDRIALEQINEGFAALKSGKTLRTLIEFP